MKLKFLRFCVLGLFCLQMQNVNPSYLSFLTVPITSRLSLPNPFVGAKKLAKKCFSYFWNNYRPITRTEFNEAAEVMRENVVTKGGETEERVKTIITEETAPISARLNETHRKVTALNRSAENILKKGKEADVALISLQGEAEGLKTHIATSREEDAKARENADTRIAQLGVSIALIKAQEDEAIRARKELCDKLPASKRNIEKIRAGLEEASVDQDAQIVQMKKITAMMAAVSKSTAFSVEQRIKQLDELDTASLMDAKKIDLLSELDKVRTKKKLCFVAEPFNFVLYSELERKLISVLDRESDSAVRLDLGTSFGVRKFKEDLGWEMLQGGVAAAFKSIKSK